MKTILSGSPTFFIGLKTNLEDKLKIIKVN